MPNPLRAALKQATNKELDGWVRYFSKRTWKSEDEARADILRKITMENERYNGLFGTTDPALVDQMAFAPARGGLVRLRYAKPPRPPVQILDEPTSNPAPVDWTARDLWHRGNPKSAFEAYGRGVGEFGQGYIRDADMPKARLAGGATSYDWTELGSRASDPPPATVLVAKNGKVSLRDGNHRVHYWREQGYDEFPVFYIDERAKAAELRRALRNANDLP